MDNVREKINWRFLLTSPRLDEQCRDYDYVYMDDARDCIQREVNLKVHDLWSNVENNKISWTNTDV